uniref:Uncharacterized protein n=1 Tax=Arundo donax TaxID=35708 RepID=A0A0A9H3Q7_ARUDO
MLLFISLLLCFANNPFFLEDAETRYHGHCGRVI